MISTVISKVNATHVGGCVKPKTTFVFMRIKREYECKHVMNDMKKMQCMKTCKVKIMIDYAHVYEDVRCPKHGDAIEQYKTLI